MGPYTIKFSISAAPAITNYFIAVLYKTTDLGSEVDRILMGNNHAAPQNCMFANLDGGVYIVRIHDSMDNVTLGNIRHDFWVDAKTNIILFETRFYRVDGPGPNDPADGSTNITDPYFDGKTISRIFQEGFRFLVNGTEWQQDAGGVLTYKNDIITGSQITNSANQVWMVEITYPVTIPVSTSENPFTDVVNVTANITLGSTQYNKIIAVAAVGDTQTTSLPGIGAVPAGKGYMVQHDGGNAVNVKVMAAGGEAFRFRGADVNSILLGTGEFIKFIKKGAKWHVVDWEGQWPQLGIYPECDFQPTNSLIRNGAEYDGTIYLRAYYIVENLIPGGQKVAFADWVGAKQTLYAIDTVAKRFKVPNHLNLSKRNIESIGGADANRADNVPNGFQDQDLMPHDHNIRMGRGSGPLQIPDQNPSDGNVFEKMGKTEMSTGLENTVKNIAVLPLMLI